MSRLKHIFVPHKIVLDNGKEVQPPFKISLVVMIILIVLIVLSARVTGFSFMKLIERGNEFVIFLKRVWPPNINYLNRVTKPMIQSIAMSFLGTFFAALVGLPFSYLSAENMNRNPISRAIVRFSLNIFRTIPVLIIALLMTYVFGLGTFAGTVAIFLFTTSIITKMTYEQIELVDMGPFEAMISTGATQVKAFIVAILPQISGLYLSTILYNLEMNIRSAAILGYVGAGGIGTLMNEAIGWRRYDNLVVILLMLLVTVVIIETISRRIRKRLV